MHRTSTSAAQRWGGLFAAGAASAGLCALSVLYREKDGSYRFLREGAMDRTARAGGSGAGLAGTSRPDRTVAIAKDFAWCHPDTVIVVIADPDGDGVAVDGPDSSGVGMAAEYSPVVRVDSDERFIVDWASTGCVAGDVAV